MHVQVIYSTTSSRMVSCYGLFSWCKEISLARGGLGSEASPLCRGTNGRLVIAMLDSVHLILREAAGTAIASFLPTLFEGGVTPRKIAECGLRRTSISVCLVPDRSFLVLISFRRCIRRTVSSRKSSVHSPSSSAARLCHTRLLSFTIGPLELQRLPKS